MADTNNGVDRVIEGAPPPRVGAMRVVAFDLDEPSGEVRSAPRTVIDFGERPGVDGMKVDVLGRLWLALRDPARPGILVLDPSGAEVGYVPIGSPQTAEAPVRDLPSNLVFGRGIEAATLYVTVDRGLRRVRVRTPGLRHPSARERRVLETLVRELVEITPGSGGFPSEFAMGSDVDGPSARPVRRVRMERSYRISRYEVTQELWEAVMGSNPSRWKGPRNSVEMLSLDEAVAFCREATWLARTGGLIAPDATIRLPSEAEWEYACRAGTSTRWSFGDDVMALGDHAWFTGNAAGNDPPVGAKAPNAWGLYDVHGYLWEWCADPWHDDFASAPEDGRAWSEDGDPERGVLRGGSWKDAAGDLASARRRFAPRGTRDDAVGLRVVLDGP